MHEKVLFVDDNRMVLDSYRRQLNQSFRIFTAQGGPEALQRLEKDGPFEVIVSDLKMPAMDGIELLERFKDLAPETVRLLLTGHADMQNALDAVNRGAIFRFLCKPCPVEEIHQALRDAVNQYEMVQARKDLHYLKKFKAAMDGVIVGFSSILEARDPYTAGHQRRVAEISCRMAGMMNFSEEHIDALRIAALLHDIGKISVPSDFLNKPGRLKREEFDVIKLHPRTGADILSHVQFDFPISTIILQHHERLDGSGYPQGLSGNEILLEAQIIAVADVLDAMSSHRPYRASLGIDAAVDELRSKSGVHFSPQIVDICTHILENEIFIQTMYPKTSQI